jgi:hypothetical protein
MPTKFDDFLDQLIKSQTAILEQFDKRKLQLAGPYLKSALAINHQNGLFPPGAQQVLSICNLDPIKLASRAPEEIIAFFLKTSIDASPHYSHNQGKTTKLSTLDIKAIWNFFAQPEETNPTFLGTLNTLLLQSAASIFKKTIAGLGSGVTNLMNIAGVNTDSSNPHARNQFEIELALAQAATVAETACNYAIPIAANAALCYCCNKVTLTCFGPPNDAGVVMYSTVLAMNMSLAEFLTKLAKNSIANIINTENLDAINKENKENKEKKDDEESQGLSSDNDNSSDDEESAKTISNR